MSKKENRRQEIYDRIRSSSKAQFILEEMQRLGYWNGDKPKIDYALLHEEKLLSEELQNLLKQAPDYRDTDYVLKVIHEKRKEAAKQKRVETKQKQEKEKQKRKETREARKQKYIDYLGRNVSYDLSKNKSNLKKLAKNNLDQISTTRQLAELLQTSVSELRFLGFHKKSSETTHYTRFYISKKSGGKRLISAPKKRLKKIQSAILNSILYKLEIQNSAHGFVPEKSIITNAKNHVAKDVVVNIDLKDFFPTITYNRVKGMFKSLGYSGQISTILALICTEPDVAPIKLNGKIIYTHISERFLPQGAPSSPAITNIICRSLDRRLLGVAEKYGFSYSRYADDMTFSGEETHLKKLLWVIKQIISEENLTIHPNKLRVMRKGQHQEVTGITVNSKLSITRKKLKKFRALLYQIEKEGFENKTWNGKSAEVSQLKGYAHFVKSVNPEKGQLFLRKISIIEEKHLKKSIWKTIRNFFK